MSLMLLAQIAAAGVSSATVADVAPTPAPASAPPQTTNPSPLPPTPPQGPPIAQTPAGVQPAPSIAREPRYDFGDTKPHARAGLADETIAVGGFYRAIYAVPSYGGAAAFSVGFGGRDHDPAWPTLNLGLHLEMGVTPQALEVGAGIVSFYPEWAIGRVQLGVEWRVGTLWMNTVTGQPPLAELAFGVAARVGVDIVRFNDEHSLFVVATVANDAFLWSGTACLGYRWDSSPRD